MLRGEKTGAVRIINTAAGMLLFLAFVICALLMTATAVGTYHRISSGYEETYGTAACAGYITNKIRSSDECTVLSDGTALVLESGRMTTVIYYGNGGIYEKSIPANGDVSIDGGDRIFEVGGLLIQEQDMLYTVALGSENVTSFSIRKG